MKKAFVVFLCLVLTGSLAGSAWTSYYDPYSGGAGYGYGYGAPSSYPGYSYSAPSSYPGYGYGGMSGYPGYGSGSIDLNGYTITPGSGYSPSTGPSTGSYIPRYTITYMPGTGVSGSPFSTEWYPGDAIISGQGFTRAGHTQTGWSFYDGGPKAFALGQHVTISSNMVLYPYWERISTALYLTVNYSGYGAVRLSGGNVPSGWTGKLEPGQSFNFIFQPYEGYYVYSIFLAGWYRNVQYGNQFMVTYDMLQGQNQVMTIRFESIYLRPKTGDDGNAALWAALALMAALGACTMFYLIKKGSRFKGQDTGIVKSTSLIITLVIILFSGFISIPYSEAEIPEEPEIWKIRGNPELEEEYKKSHPFLDDINYWPIEHPVRVQEFGYSYIWDILEVRLVGENGGEEVLLYYDVPENYIDGFKETNDPDRFYNYYIENEFQRMKLPKYPI